MKSRYKGFGESSSACSLSVVFMAALSCFSATTNALEFQCDAPGDTRFIRVEIPAVEPDRLCEVSVTYQQTGVRDVKWFARNDTLFCSARAYELRDKYVDKWNFNCAAAKDRDGIDLLSEAQRRILDQRLKNLIALGKQSTPTFSITGVKAVASNPLNNEPAKIALQFFTEIGDFTEIIDDRTSEWNITTIIENMATQIESDQPVTSALVHSISNEGTMEIHTNVAADSPSTDCFGSQTLTPVGSNGLVMARTPHRYICEQSSAATTLTPETQTQ